MPDIVCPICRDGVVFVRPPDEVRSATAEQVAEDAARHLNGERVDVYTHAAGYARYRDGYVVNGLWGHGGRSHGDFTLAQAWPHLLVPIAPEQADVLQCPGCRRWHARHRLRSTRCDDCLAKEAAAEQERRRRAEDAARAEAQARAEAAAGAGSGARPVKTRPTPSESAGGAWSGPSSHGGAAAAGFPAAPGGVGAHPVARAAPSLLGDLAAAAGSLFYVGFSLCAGQLVVGVPLLIVAAWAWTRHRRGEELGDDLRLALVGLGVLYAAALVVPFV